MSTSSPSTDNYCEDNPGVCIGIPVVVAIAILIVLAVVVLLLAYSNSRRMLCELTLEIHAHVLLYFDL